MGGVFVASATLVEAGLRGWNEHTMKTVYACVHDVWIWDNSLTGMVRVKSNDEVLPLSFRPTWGTMETGTSPSSGLSW